MDKQDAIDFIVEQFEEGRSPSEIARSLSAELNAPYEIVLAFVNRTLEKRLALTELQEFSQITTVSLPLPAADVGSVSSKLALETSPEEFAPAENAWSAPTEPARAAYSWEPQVASDLPAAPSQAQAAAPAASSFESIDPRLEKFIIDQLSGHKKNSDVVMAVCERAHVDWNEAQRLVGYTQSKNHKKITTRRNLFMIPFSAAALLAGLALLGAIVQEAAPYIPILQRFNEGGLDAAMKSLPAQDIVSPRSLLFYFTLGMSLTLGGSVGLIRALKTQFE